MSKKLSIVIANKNEKNLYFGYIIIMSYDFILF